MKKEKTTSAQPELLQVKLPATKIIYLDDLVRLLPIPVHRTSLWAVLFGHSCCCSCCCSCGETAAHGQAVAAPAPSPTGPSSPTVTVAFNVSIRQFIIVGSGLAVEANFTWAATGAPGLTVNVQVKSSVTYANWTNILTNQPPVDLGTWPVSGVPGETFHFRAVAIDPQGNPAAYSQIVTI